MGMPSPFHPGWNTDRTWNGRVLPFDLSQVGEEGSPAPRRTAALHPLADGPTDVSYDRKPVVLVHSLPGPPADMQAVADVVRRSAHQPWMTLWPDDDRSLVQHAHDLAAELQRLAAQNGPARGLILVAHGLGGLLVRRALNALATDAGGLARFGPITVLTADTPWHGYTDPTEAHPDLHATSPLFCGDPDGMYSTPLPADQVRLEIAFAEKGGGVVDFTEARMRHLADVLLADPTLSRPVDPDPRLQNLWSALTQSHPYPDFRRELDMLAARKRLMPATLQALIGRHWRHWPGDHLGMLQHPRDGRPCWLDHVATHLGISAR